MKRLTQHILYPSFILLVVALAIGCAGSQETPSEPTEFVVNLPSSPPTTQSEMEAEIEPVISTVGLETSRWWGTDLDVGRIIEGAESTLTRMPHGLAMTFKTVGLPPGDAVTIWWIIFNKPENCSNGDCGFDDVFQVDESGQVMFDEAGVPLPNAVGREAVGFSSLRADGKVVEIDGGGEFRGHLPIGDMTEVGLGPGLLNPMTAEIHLFARSHGPAIPGGTHDQLNSPWGGCEPWKAPCADLQVGIHKPPQP